ncbi:MAG: polysaccharide deacetylase family protein [Chitinophagales bacterium]
MSGFLQQKTLGLFVKTNGALSQWFYGGLGRIFVFHRVLPKEKHYPLFGANGMAVSPQYLDWFIPFVKEQGFEFISLDEMHKRLLAGKSTKPFAVITIDDGWLDNLTYGLPVFEKHQVPFAIYVTNCFAEHTAVLWAETLERFLLANTSLQFTFMGEVFIYSFETVEARRKVFNQIRSFVLNASSLEEYNERIASFIKLMPPAEEGAFALNHAQIAQLAAHPLCTIGAHTVNHLPLAKLSAEDAFNEISLSKQKVAAITGKEVKHFAYPYGTANECNTREFAMAAKAGYATAVTGRPANVFAQHNQHLMAIPRFSIGEATNAERLKYILNGILHFSFNGFKKVVTE